MRHTQERMDFVAVPRQPGKSVCAECVCVLWSCFTPSCILSFFCSFNSVCCIALSPSLVFFLRSLAFCPFLVLLIRKVLTLPFSKFHFIYFTHIHNKHAEKDQQRKERERTKGKKKEDKYARAQRKKNQDNTQPIAAALATFCVPSSAQPASS